MAVKKHASELLYLPAYFYLMLSVIPIFLVPYANDQPLFGDPKIRYGSPPWAPDCYPIFGRQRHLTRRTPKAHQFRKRMLHFWFAGLLVSLALSLLSFFGRDCLLRDNSIVSYDMLNRESNRTFPSELSSLELEVVVRHSSWKTFVKAKINTAEGDSYSFESQDFFANKDRALALRSMQTLKGMVPPQNVSLQGRDKLAQFADVSLPLSDEQIEAMRKRIDRYNRAETRISKTAMPELREAMALYLVEHIDELENQDKT